jgi:hypothetical protein
VDPGALRRAVEGLAQPIVTEEERTAIEARFTTPKTDTTAGGLDEIAYLGALTDLLIEREPVDPADLTALAVARRDTVVSALLAVPGVTADRVQPGDPVEVEVKDDSVTLEFGVDVAPTAPSGELPEEPEPGTHSDREQELAPTFEPSQAPDSANADT